MSEEMQKIVIEALARISLSNTQGNLIDTQLVHSIVIRGTHVGFALECKDAQTAAQLAPIKAQCEAALLALSGIEKVTISLTSAADSTPQPKPSQPQKGTPSKLPSKIIAIGAGKGGVGKSTLTLLTAYALKNAGYKVAIVDADIYGPSLPTMLGIRQGTKPQLSDSGKMIPLKNHGISAHSIGFLVAEGEATIWRGPMATKALHQLLFGTDWSDCDIMLIDLPPGTGDVQLTLAKQVPLSAAMLVSTPQQVALTDVKKAATMFQKLNIPLLGIVENMSYLQLDNAGEKQYLFGRGNVAPYAQSQDITYLGDIALMPAIGDALDKGESLEKYVGSIPALLKIVAAIKEL
jgi:ATP-binding protein involved in chromosome partitioning